MENFTKKHSARIVGVLFIIGTVSGILSVLINPFTTAPDMIATIAENENRVIWGSIMILCMGLSLAMIPVVLYPILKKWNEPLAMGAIVFRGVLETGLYIAMVVNGLLMLSYSKIDATLTNESGSASSLLGELFLDADMIMAHVMSIVFCIEL